MKKIGIVLLVAAGILTMGSCGNKSEKVPFDNGDSLGIEVDSTLYGICGEATSMNMLQMITDTGDTLMLDISAAKENDQVFGGLQVGDRMAVLPNDNKTVANTVINQTTLLGNWVMPNPIDGSDEVGISIKEGGVAESIDQGSIIYRTWRLSKGRLEIVLVREGGNDVEELNVYDILKLTADSLVYKDAEETFEYERQKPKETYGEDVKLEDSSYDDFKM
ncbi:MAG: hypothetical protein IJ804_00220 [Prevotella sp.]|jgi:hypothetical protein|nr:hypothetical protein [Prevotella sp.]